MQSVCSPAADPRLQPSSSASGRTRHPAWWLERNEPVCLTFIARHGSTETLGAYARATYSSAWIPHKQNQSKRTDGSAAPRQPGCRLCSNERTKIPDTRVKEKENLARSEQLLTDCAALNGEEGSLQVSFTGILTVSGGGCSTEDAQDIKGNHMQRKNHLPSLGAVLSVCPQRQRGGKTPEDRFLLAPPTRRVRRSLMWRSETLPRRHSLTARRSPPLSLSSPSLSLPLSLYWQNKSIAMPKHRYANAEQ